MNQVYKWVDTFFASLENYIGIGDAFLIFVGLFLFVGVITFIATSSSYEAKLVKAIDMLNGYFVNNPKITEDNLVLFNQIMRHNKVPKLLRKHWQQFMLYRENNASFYMSFENCVSIPLRNSKFKRDKIIMNVFAYILAAASLIVNAYLTPSAIVSVADAIQKIFLAPILILLVNYILSIILDLKQSAIINDLNQNYQYFETNIDKATKTLPEYVDYEILFDKAEIKKGIPILYQYLQKRADEEQRELELARLKNVEHEKFNFDEAGLAGSLVLERAMQEAENYIAERKKYGQDIAQINSEIAQEDISYREITKEYNRQMQVSKETFANFKQQLEQASSTIEANYLKKQQQQELDRQRNLERDFDTATDRHKKVIESYQAELDSIDKFIADSRKSLEDAMMAEFATYSGKVYDEAKKVVEEKEKEKHNKFKKNIKELEEQLYAKNKEIENIYSGESTISTQPVQDVQPEPVEDVKEVEEIQETPTFNYLQEEPEQTEETAIENEIANDVEDTFTEKQESEEVQTNNWNFNFEDEQEEKSEESFDLPNEKSETTEDNQETMSYSDFLKQENLEPFEFDANKENENSEEDNSWLNEEVSTVQEDESTQTGESIENKSSNEEDDENGEEDFGWFDNILDEPEEKDVQSDEEDEEDEDSEQPLEIAPVVVKKKAGRPRKIVTEVDNTPKRKPGRPKKVVETQEEIQPTKQRGRPKKVVENVDEQPKRSVGRPKKKKAGRPRKVVEEKVDLKPKAPVGRPKKVVENVVEQPKRSVGRPKKKKAGRPRKIEQVVETTEKKKVGRPKKERQINNVAKRSVGRPKKVNLNTVDGDVDLEAYLKVIDNAIAKENAKIKRSQRALENNANIKTKKKK